MEEITKRFFEYLAFKNLTSYRFSKLNPRITSQKISNFKSGRNNITLEVILALSKTFPNEVNLDWLITGKGERDQKQTDILTVKKIPFVSAKTTTAFVITGKSTEFIDYPFFTSKNSSSSLNSYICYEVTNGAMNNGSSDSFLKNDILLVKKIKLKKWEIKLSSNHPVLVIHNIKGIHLGIPKKNKHDLNFYLHFLNPEYDKIPLHFNEIQALFQVIDFKRKITF